MEESELKVFPLSGEYCEILLNIYRQYKRNIAVHNPYLKRHYTNGLEDALGLLDGRVKKMLMDYSTSKAERETLMKNFNEIEQFLNNARRFKSYKFLYILSDRDNIYQSRILACKEKMKELGIINNVIILGTEHSKDGTDEDRKFNTNLHIWRGTLGDKMYKVIHTDSRSLALMDFIKIIKEL